MVLTGAQITTFFENNNQMGIPHETMVQMAGGNHRSVNLGDLVSQKAEMNIQLACNTLRSFLELVSLLI